MPPLTFQQLREFQSAPTLPQIVARVRTVVRRRDSGVRDVAQAVMRDPVISAKLLRVANSAYYSLAEKTLDVQRAAAVLGIQALSAMVVGTRAMDGLQGSSKERSERILDLWRHSIFVGQVCQRIAKDWRRRGTDASNSDYYTFGLLHDLGRIVLFDKFGDPYLEFSAAHGDDPAALALEREQFGSDHTSVGSVLAAEWGMPHTVMAAMGEHHSRERAESDDVVAVVAAADEIAHSIERAHDEDPQLIARRLRSNSIPYTQAQWAELVRTARSMYGAIEL